MWDGGRCLRTILFCEAPDHCMGSGTAGASGVPGGRHVSVMIEIQGI